MMRIISDGTGRGTRVLDDYGNSVEGVESIAVRITATGVARVKIHMTAVPIDIEVPDDVVEVDR